MPVKKKKRLVYLDNAATTPVDGRVFKAMEPFFTKSFGNPSALYSLGMEANGALNDSRRSIADVLHTTPDAILFTSSGSESDNLAIFGVAGAWVGKPGHIITTTIEHHAVLEPIAKLEKKGWRVTRLNTDQNGFVSEDDVMKALQPDTALISIMFANNEIGTIEPIAAIGRQLLRHRKATNSVYPYFHTDACQAAGYLDLDVEKLHVDLTTINGSKIYGPKGVGALYVRRGVKLEAQVYGGSQERTMRAGTENVPGVVGLAAALALAHQKRETGVQSVRKLTKYFWGELKKTFPNVVLNGPEIGEYRLPNNLNVCFGSIDGENIVLYLDSYGIMCSTGSACTAHSAESSHVLRAIGKTTAEASQSVRFSLGIHTTKQDIDYTVQCLKKIFSITIPA